MYTYTVPGPSFISKYRYFDIIEFEPTGLPIILRSKIVILITPLIKSKLLLNKKILRFFKKPNRFY